MGLQVTKTEEGRFILASSVSGGNYHEEDTVSIEEAKAILIQDERLHFWQKAIEIDMTFPAGYSVNGKRLNPVMDFHDWYGKVLKEDNWQELIEERFNQIKF